jgi:hypothetical protein
MKSLCNRCEHRAIWLEGGNAPRYECGQHWAVGACYMFEPVKPILVCRNKSDKRPMFAGWALSARVNAVQVEPKVTLAVRKQGKYYLPIWVEE